MLSLIKASDTSKSWKFGITYFATIDAMLSSPPKPAIVSPIIHIATHIKDIATENKNDFDKLHITIATPTHIHNLSHCKTQYRNNAKKFTLAPSIDIAVNHNIALAEINTAKQNTPKTPTIPKYLPTTKSEELTDFDNNVIMVLFSISDAIKLQVETTAIIIPKKFKAPDEKSKTNFIWSLPKSRR